MLAVLVRSALDSSSVRDGDLRHQGVLHWCLLMLATLSKCLVASCILVASFDDCVGSAAEFSKVN